MVSQKVFLAYKNDKSRITSIGRRNVNTAMIKSREQECLLDKYDYLIIYSRKNIVPRSRATLLILIFVAGTS